MDTTISGGVFQTLPEILSILPSADCKNRRPKKHAPPPPAPLTCQASATLCRPAAPSGPWLASAPLGSPLPRSLRLRLFPEPQAAGCGAAPGAGCRCRTGRQLRGRPSGAPQLAEGRRAASGTDGEWRRARRPPQVRKAPGAARVGASGLGAAHLGRPGSPPSRGPRLRSRSFSTRFGNALVPVPLPFSEHPAWQSGSFRRASLASVGVRIPPPFPPLSPLPLSLALRATPPAFPRAPAGVCWGARLPLRTPLCPSVGPRAQPPSLASLRVGEMESSQNKEALRSRRSLIVKAKAGTRGCSRNFGDVSRSPRSTPPLAWAGVSISDHTSSFV